MARARPWPSVVAALAIALLLLGVAGCSAAVPDAPAQESRTAPTSEDAPEEEPTPPPGATDEFDDINDDGEPDATCVDQDFGGGLVVRLLCRYADYAEPPTADTELVPNSLFGLPSAEIDLTGISGTAGRGRTLSGQRLVVLFITSDTLFATGSADLSEPATVNFDAIAALLEGDAPTASVQVRGHTDATGNPSANQALSEQRAATVVDYLVTKGIDRSRLSSVGLGQTVPIVLETTADGAVNPTGQQYNRRVELAILLP